MLGVGIAVGVEVLVGGTGVFVGDGSAVAVDRSGLRVGAGVGIVGAALANSTLASTVASISGVGAGVESGVPPQAARASASSTHPRAIATLCLIASRISACLWGQYSLGGKETRAKAVVAGGW